MFSRAAASTEAAAENAAASDCSPVVIDSICDSAVIFAGISSNCLSVMSSGCARVRDDNTLVKSKAPAKEKRLFFILRIICTARFKGKGGKRREETWDACQGNS